MSVLMEQHLRHAEAKIRMQLAGMSSVQTEISNAKKELARIQREIALARVELDQLRKAARRGQLREPPRESIKCTHTSERYIRKNVVLRAVADAHDVAVLDLFGSSRRTEVVAAKHHAATVLTVGRSLSEVGRIMNRDHSTIIHSCARWKEIKHLYAREIKVVDEALRQGQDG